MIGGMKTETHFRKKRCHSRATLDDGVNLLVYVMRAPRIVATAKANYELFFETFCYGQVPIVIVVTGLEDKDDMDKWWEENKSVFDDYKMPFSGSACITATQGKLLKGGYLLTRPSTKCRSGRWRR